MAPLVSTNASPPSIELQDLRLDDARALLDHGPELNLPSADALSLIHI